MRGLADSFTGFINGVEKTDRGIKRILQQVIPILPDDVILRRRPDDVFHVRFFRALCFFARPWASVLRSFQHARVSGMSSPPVVMPSTRSVSSRASSSRAWRPAKSGLRLAQTFPRRHVYLCTGRLGTHGTYPRMIPVGILLGTVEAIPKRFTLKLN